MGNSFISSNTKKLFLHAAAPSKGPLRALANRRSRPMVRRHLSVSHPMSPSHPLFSNLLGEGAWVLRLRGGVRGRIGEGKWVGCSFLRTMGPPFSSSPTDQTQPYAGCGWGSQGESWVSSTRLLLAGSRAGFAQGESCQLCPFKNEQQRGKEKKKEREVRGEHRVGVGEARAERTGGDYLNRRPDSAVSFH